MRTRALLLVLAFLGLARVAVFATVTFNAVITHDQETGASGTTALTTSTGQPRPLSFGTATFTLNDAMTQLSFTATIFNIDVTGTQTPDTFDNLGAAHIHAPGPVGTNGPVVWGFFGSPDNDTNPDNLVVTPFASGVGGVFSSVWDLPEGNGGANLANQLPSILAGASYINFHTVQFGGGEIRGQIIPSTPDGGSTAMLLLGSIVALFGLTRFRKAASS